MGAIPAEDCSGWIGPGSVVERSAAESQYMIFMQYLYDIHLLLLQSPIQSKCHINIIDVYVTLYH